MTALDRIASIDDLRRLARRRTPRFLFDAMEQGAGTGAAVRRNTDDFRDFAFVPRSMIDVRGVNLEQPLFDRSWSLPFGISAVGLAGIYRRHADEMFAEAARAAGIPFILSGAGTASVETIARIAPDNTWFQLYFAKTFELTERMILRARDCGVPVLVLTIDYPVTHRSQPATRAGVSLAVGVPPARWPAMLLDVLGHPRWLADYLAMGGHPRLGSWAPFAPPGSTAQQVARYYIANWPGNPLWPDIARIRAIWPGRLVLKGVLHPEDARLAVKHGIDAITVSNHGGNKLDCVPSAIECLPAVMATVGDRIPVFFDSGLRKGSDMMVAMALGARFCFIGRSALYGAVGAGYPGARKAVDLLAAELRNAMAMIGAVTPAGLPSATLLHRGVPVTPRTPEGEP
jgi:L-lactate dehydrogenase (cytochrome)/(S)-mandelate dehydrogenase